MTEDSNFLRIAVVGAGAAGFFAAAAIKKNCANTQVTVIHDPKTPFIGVGESLGWGGPNFFSKYLGLHNDLVWLKKSGSTLKYSVTLQNWHDESDEKYYMTFPFNPSYKVLNKSIWDPAFDEKYIKHDYEYNIYTILLHLRSKGLIDDYTLQQYANEFWWYAKHKTCHINRQAVGTQKFMGYSYHINADHIRHVVHDMVGKPAGVEEIAQRVQSVVLKENGYIDHLILENGQTYHADLFIDATGFSRILAKNLPFEFEPCDEYCNNSALVGSHKFKDHSEYTSETLTAGMKYGWRFSIPVNGRSGEGYQFNSNIFDDEQQLVDEYYEKTGKVDVQFRRIKWQPGYYKNAMVNNCVTLGISHGFSDVFDANNFSDTIRHIGKLVDYISDDPGKTFSWRDQFNRMVDLGNQIIVTRIQTAFHLARRNDSIYWQAMKEAERKFHTREKLIDISLDPKMRMYPGSSPDSNRLYTNHVFINQALYNRIEFPKERCILDISPFEEQQALIFFQYFKDTYNLRAQNSQSIEKFYRSVYPLIDSEEEGQAPTRYLDFLG